MLVDFIELVICYCDLLAKALVLLNPTELEIFYCDLGAKALLLGIRSELNFTMIWGQKPSRFFRKLCPDAL